MATKIRFSRALAKIFSIDTPTFRSDSAMPGRSALVESDMSSKTPSRPSSPSLVRSIIRPRIGVVSILKSPMSIIVPTGVLTANAALSANE